MRNYQKGQGTILGVVLVMVIALTIGLSVATRTITNLRTTAEEESSQRAFSAAEAGIEQALQDNTQLGNSGTFANKTTYETSISALSGVEFILNNGVTVLKDDAVDLWLSTYPDYTSPWTGTLTLYWGSASDECSTAEEDNSLAALEVVLITGAKNKSQLTHYAVDPCSSRGGPSGNKFEVISPGGGTIEGKTFGYKKTISVASGLLMRIIPLYASATIAVKGCDESGGNCNPLPSQGKLITSVGTSDTTERKIIGFQENPKLPVQIFPYIIFSPK